MRTEDKDMMQLQVPIGRWIKDFLDLVRDEGDAHLKDETDERGRETWMEHVKM